MHTLSVVLFTVFLTIDIGISTVYIYFHWYLKGNTNNTNINPRTETVIY